MTKEKTYTVGEASDLAGVPAHTIRFWEKGFSEFLRPIRTSGGQRRYGPDDVRVIRRIKHYRYERGYTIAGTRRMLLTHEADDAPAGPGGRLKELAVLLRQRARGR